MMVLSLRWMDGVLFLQMYSIIFASQVSSSKLDVCSLDSCISPNASSKDFINHCMSTAGNQIKGHCCFRPSSDQVTGIDLSYCKLKNIKSLLHPMTDVMRLNLTHNPDLSYENTSFVGLTKLKMLILDKSVDCPGQWRWFNTTWKPWKLAEYEKHTVRCLNQTDTCEQLKGFNYTCPVHSECENNGPGSFSCRCERGWGGYRCLRKTNHDVALTISASITGATLFLSVILWSTQRRHVQF